AKERVGVDVGAELAGGLARNSVGGAGETTSLGVGEARTSRELLAQYSVLLAEVRDDARATPIEPHRRQGEQEPQRMRMVKVGHARKRCPSRTWAERFAYTRVPGSVPHGRCRVGRLCRGVVGAAFVSWTSTARAA